MDPGLFDVLHHTGDQDVALRVGERVDVDFGGVFEEAVDQHGALLGEVDRLLHVAAYRVLVVGDYHRPAAEHVAGAHQHRVADAARDGAGLLDVRRGAVGRRRDP